MKRKIIMGIAIVALLSGVGFVMALDPPHDTTNSIGCSSCHVPHTAPGGSLTKADGIANLCLSCHTSGDPIAGGKPFEPSDQAVMGVSGTSHRWDALLVNATTGTQDWPPNNPIVIDRSDAPNPRIVCSSCHDQHHHDQRDDIGGNLTAARNPFDPTAPAAPAFGKSPDGRHYMQMSNEFNQLCRDCHRNRDLNYGTDNGNPRKFTDTIKSHPVQVTLPATTLFNNPPLDINGVPQLQDSGAADSVGGGGNTNLTDLSKGWAANVYLNYYVRITSGTAKNQTRQITSNDGDTIFWGSGIAGLSAGDDYEIDGDGNLTNDVILDSNSEVQCMTCHSPHNADSDAATYDGF